jgi:3-hydroxy-9,10-secoandrosta-1,3,5(10)-triene-9,17-dione monooxygenase
VTTVQDDAGVERDWAPTIERATTLAVELARQAAETEAARQVRDEAMQALYREMLLRHFQPERYGGDGAPWGLQFDIGRVLAQGCPSTSWIATVVAANNCYACRFPSTVQEEIFGDGPDVLVANASVQKDVQIVPDGDGYRLSGRWKFASGIDHADWILIAGTLSTADGSPTEARQFMLVPARDWIVEDTWFVSGMRGTGSKDIFVDGAFVPAHRTLPIEVFWGDNPPGGEPGGPFISPKAASMPISTLPAPG